jgi:3-oxoacyl-[acyl-carrier-protein] synthase-1
LKNANNFANFAIYKQNFMRVVITGMGIYSCLGQNKEQVQNSLYKGISGIGVDPVRKEAGFQSALTGIVPEVDLKALLDRKSRISVPQQGAYAYVATLEALEQSGITKEFLLSNEVGVLYGNDSSAMSVITGANTLREKKNTALIGSGNIFQSMNSTVTMNLSCLFNLRGINFTVSGACASGSHAIGLGYLLVKQGLQDIIICGGAQEVNPYAVGSFDGLFAFSKREDEPARASRPFDKSRDGLVPSGGAATVIIESYESAKQRGAPILGEILGYGFSSNGEHLSVPNVDGPFRSLQMAIKQSGICMEDIAYVNAHATSTPVGDRNEAEAILRTFGSLRPYIASTKSYTGHEMWMAGASEIVYSLLMMHGNFIAPNLNYEEGDEITSQLNIPAARIDTSFDLFLSNSFGFGGTNSSLIIRKV